MNGTTATDPWQARLDRLRRYLPLPLLAVATAGALVTPNESADGPPFNGLYVLIAAAVWSVAVSAWLRPNASANWRLAAFAVHTALAGVLVWVNSWYGVFAYTGFLFAYPVGQRWRKASFAATALVVAASMSGGYPSSDADRTLTYLLVAGVMLTLVLTSATITNLALEQNRQRGQMISDLAEANRRLAASMAENAQLHDQLLWQAREAGIVEERQRLAGEIHDTLAQGLTGIIAQLQAAQQTRNHPAEWSRHLDQAQDLARSSLTEARRSVRALRPEQLEDATLPDALGALAGAWSRQRGIAVNLDVSGAPVVTGADVEAALFRVAQEALSNVGKHAGACRVQLTLTYLDDILLLDIADDGAGFNPDDRTEGYGLTGMRRRLARVGGTLTIESSPGYGATLNAAVPLVEPALEATA
jgi:signal transduction histidine kinase